MRPLPVLFILLVLSGCATVRYEAPASQPAPTSSRSLTQAVHWMRNSAEYQAAVRQTYAVASRRLPELVREKPPGTWAVALDADDTVISNTEYDRELTLQGKSSNPELWDAWVARRAAPPLPGAVEFMQLVQELGGRVAIVTNRLEEHCPDTMANFRAFDIPFDVMLCRDEDREKEPRWRQVRLGTAAPGLPPLDIVMWLGDNIRDFPGLDQETRFQGAEAFEEFGNRFFVVPNPLYGSWSDNPQD